jgi:hypothetical protein
VASVKDDVGPAPEAVPSKRAALKAAPDLWIAQWLARESTKPSQRRKLEDEKKRRRRAPRPTVGFTGSREGMTPAQRRTVERLVSELAPGEAHHGDCVGADETFHSICRRAKVPVVGHPPQGNRLRAFCTFDREEPAKPYLERDKDVVRAATVLVATPKEEREPTSTVGHGTWTTVRYARERGVPARVVLPDGSLLGERSDGR